MSGVSEHGGRICLLLVLAFLALGLVCLPATAQLSTKGVVDLDGHPANPFQKANGKIVVLLFIRTDCPISNRYTPTIQEMSAHFAKQAEFFLVYPIRSESAEQIRKHLKEYGYKLQAVRDPELQLVHAAQVKVTPEAAVFSAEGRLLYHGRIDDWYADLGRARPAPTTHELYSAVESAIAGKPVSVAAVPAVGCFLPDTP
ncbi:MAG: redoxin domain-containing protein [Candidatus Acidiferrum sp.]